ncbi:MAG: hypothetical protein ACR2FS_03080 [Phormidesmis sp.]
MANQKAAAKITAEQEALEAQAAQWRAIEPLLPQIIQRGVMALLDGAAPTSELGLSGAKQQSKSKQPIDRVIDWKNLPNSELLQETSEPACAERLRRSMEAFEQFNQSSDFKLAPTPQTLASHSGTEDGYAQLWLARGGHQDRLKEYLQELNFADIGAATVGNRVALSMAGVRSARELLKWSESAYGSYTW